MKKHLFLLTFCLYATMIWALPTDLSALIIANDDRNSAEATNTAFVADSDMYSDWSKDNTIQINSQEDFNRWVDAMNDKDNSSSLIDKDVDLNTDISVKSTTGSLIPRFNGVLNGNGHRLTLDMKYTIPEGNDIEIGHAFISALYGTVKNLCIDGRISGNTKYLASVAKDLCDGAVVENVTSTVNIVSGIFGDGTHGGIAGRCEGSATLRNVVFAGTMSGENTDCCGGLVGWVSQPSTFESCLMIADIQVNPNGGNTIGRNQDNINGRMVFAIQTPIDETPLCCKLVTPEQLKSGEICFALNGNQRNIAWYQTLGEDPVPVLDKTHKQVYSSGTYSCDGTLIGGTAVYSNEGVVNILHHEWNEFGICDNCGQAKPDFIEPNADGYFIVDSPGKLVYVSSYATSNPTANILITQDLDMAEVTEYYKPIRGAYAGIFDGGGHTISNLIINNVPNETTGEGATTVNDQALIGLAGGCTVKNLTLDATCSITGGGYSAGFVGETTGSETITMGNLFMHGNVRAEGPNGAGIYGCNMSSTAIVVMKNCGVTGNIVGSNEAGALSGWLGSGKATVTNCWFTGTIEGCDNMEESVFCRPAADVSLSNCWSYLGSRDGVGKLSSKDAASSGQLAWNLNGGRTDSGVLWRQNLGEDICPTIDPTHNIVYKSADGKYVNKLDTPSHDKFLLPDFEMSAGESMELAVQFDSDRSDEYVAFQFDLYLSGGLSVVQKNGKYVFTFNEARSDDHTFSSALQKDGSIRVAAVSLTNSSFSGEKGDFVYFSLAAADDLSGSYEVFLKNIYFSTKTGERVKLPDVTAHASVTPPDIKVTGITLDREEVELIEGESVMLTATVHPFDATERTVVWTSSGPDIASVNDGRVTGIRAGKATVTAQCGECLAACDVVVHPAEVPFDGEFVLPDFEMSAGESMELAVQFDSDRSDEYVAFQFDLYLSGGLSVVQKNGKYVFTFNEARSDDHTFSSALQKDGSIRVAAVSLTNSSFSGEKGDFVYFSLAAADDLSGSHEVFLKNIYFSTKKGERVKLPDVKAKVMISISGNGINITKETKEYEIYTLDGKKTKTFRRGVIYVINGKKILIK